MTLRALIVDDETVARRRIRRLLTAEPAIVVAGECADGASAVEAMTTERPDVVFLDVQMPELDGFGVLRRLVHAIDYLLKPFTRERFRLALDRARERIRRSTVDAALASLAVALRSRPRYLSRLPVRAAGRIILVDLATVDWIEAADNYVRLHAGRREYLLRDTLARLEQRLDPERFVRIHRSAIVQVDRVSELHPASHGDMEVVLRNGTVLTLSRTWRDHMQGLFGPVR
jgi:two-component system LytT family response regulator